MTREIEGQIFDAERRGAGPSTADLRPDYYGPDTFDEDGDYDEWAAPCELCHYTKGHHADGCPGGDLEPPP